MSVATQSHAVIIFRWVVAALLVHQSCRCLVEVVCATAPPIEPHRHPILGMDHGGGRVGGTSPPEFGVGDTKANRPPDFVI